jgi:DNA-directed RNA polymerase alpha subunit
MSDTLNVSIRKLGLSPRARNCLSRARIATIRDLAQTSEGQLLRTWSVGRKTVSEINEALQSMGLHLGMTSVDIAGSRTNGHTNRAVDRENAKSWRRYSSSGWIDDLELSTRAHKCLKDARIRTVQELSEMSDEELLSIRNLGRNTLIEIRGALHANSINAKVVAKKTEETPPQAHPEINNVSLLFVPQSARGRAIKDLPISVRLENVLEKKGCRLLGDLNGRSLEEILKSKNCGRHTVNELIKLVQRVQAGEFESRSEMEGSREERLIKFIDELVMGMPLRERGIVLMRYGADGGDVATLQEIGSKYEITRERVRQILQRMGRQFHKAVSMRFDNLLRDMAAEHLAATRPLTPEVLSYSLGSYAANTKFSLRFYIRIMHELTPSMPAWPEGQKTAARPQRANNIVKALREILSGDVSAKPLDEGFELLKASRKVPKLESAEFLEALRQTESLPVDFRSPDCPTIKLSNLRTRDWVTHVLSQAEGPLTPEQIIERANDYLGDRFKIPSPFGLANKLKPKDGFYLLDRRAVGLRQHFRLPLRLWRNVRSDYMLLLKREDRPISTSEVCNERMFDWVALTNAYEIAQVLREDDRFTDLGRFLFALTEWGIEEREYVNDLIPRVLANAGHPMTGTAICDELQRFRSITPTSMASVLRGNAEVRDYGFGYYGLKAWGDTSRAFLVSEKRLVNRIIGRSEPPFSFGQLCSVLEVSEEPPLADRLWETVQSLPKVRCQPNEKGIDTVLSHDSWSLERALSSLLTQTSRALPPYEIQWELGDRFGPAFAGKSLSDVERALERNALFVRNTAGEYILDHQLEEHLPDFANFRDACFEILSNCNEIVGCEDLLERIRAEEIDVKNVSTSMLASILRGDESFEEVGSQRFRAKR